MNEKQQQLTFEKGMTTVPSDALCSDNALEEVTGLTFRDSEHHVIQKPVVKAETGNRKLLFVHKLANGVENYIFEILNKADNKLWLWCNNYTTNNGPSLAKSQHTLSVSPKDVTAVGKTLVVNMDGKLRYFVWQGEYYHALADLPSLSIYPTLKKPYGGFMSDQVVATGSGVDIAIIKNNYLRPASNDKQKDYNNLLVGLYSKTLKLAAEKKGFAKPFFVRAALEMYDGTYTMITNPVLMWPTISGSSRVTYTMGLEKVSIYTYYYFLQITQSKDFSEYIDIVKDVVIFVSDGIDVYDTTVDQGTSLASVPMQAIYLNGVPSAKMTLKTEMYYDSSKPDYLVHRERTDIASDIVTTSVFYKVCSIGLKPVENLDLREKISTHTLENLTTQDQLGIDDYFSRCSLSSKMIYAYNNRLNVAGVERGFFEGFEVFMPIDSVNDDTFKYNIYVRIKTNDGYRTVKHEFYSTNIITEYFYYPDPRADRVTVYSVNDSDPIIYLNVDLKEHPGLNGAYYYDEEFAGESVAHNDGQRPLDNRDVNTTPESLGGQLLQSEVNNPFTFLASGYHQVGNGNIIGMAAMTTALSQGQFGQYPLMVFTTEGIWGMSVNSTGLYTAAHPMSREVALKDNPCITQTDGAVFFVSKKGLMVVVGNDVKCCSEQLNGKSRGANFQNILAASDLHIAYDYRDSLLWLFSQSLLQDRALVYAIKSSTFSWCNCGFTEERVVNNYPDYLVQGSDDGSNLLYTLYWRPNANSDTLTYDAHIVTRPMKLENALALKSILEVRHIYSIGSGYAASLAFRIFASNNLQDWLQLGSLRGQPWKYYRFEYTFNNLKANDTFDGTVLITQERRTNKLR